ncbi:hypothetical protein [Candidatus Kryptobacter tengchongensis]|uniref:1,4-dihydroxy-2-naphthoate octaprenyltransferase n=1 Tax=Kryptobacter tengchongensis TaxID=1643429 RepID=A0A916LJN8_KRYT1|nr:hypothetical protein [Candidatus Kryptobacter tengchongensis]CUT01311.1 1,4-dihydroxy-2-naphthoate octaprenyltransferase [Candidatus Kryptobacter tengchongensis]
MKAFFYNFKSIIFHLRFNISIALLPVFLWGYALTEADISRNFINGIIILHLLIYPASNGIYSYFDERKGVIYGFKGVKPASVFTLVASIILLLVGIYWASKVNISYFSIVLAFAILFFLFSFPSTGIKKRPFYAISFLGLTYGLLGFLAGWVCAFDLKGLLNPFHLGGAVSSAGFVAGFYTLSLVYRISEDSIPTGGLFVEKLGLVGVFRFVKIILPISGLIATIVIAGKFTLYELIGIIIYFLIGFLVVERFEKNFHLQKEFQNYRTIMNINLTNSIILSSYLFFRILAVNYLLID